MSSLYKIQEKYLQLERILEENEGVLDEEQNKEWDINQEEFAEKTDQYIKLIRNTQNDVLFAQSELERINKYISTKENFIARLQDQLLNAIMMFGTKEVKVDKKTSKTSTIYRYECGTFRLSTRKSPTRVEIDEELIDNEWKRVSISELSMEDLAKVLDVLGKSSEEVKTKTDILKTPIKKAIEEEGQLVRGATIVEGKYSLSLK